MRNGNSGRQHLITPTFKHQLFFVQTSQVNDLLKQFYQIDYTFSFSNLNLNLNLICIFVNFIANKFLWPKLKCFIQHFDFLFSNGKKRKQTTHLRHSKLYVVPKIQTLAKSTLRSLFCNAISFKLEKNGFQKTQK